MRLAALRPVTWKPFASGGLIAAIMAASAPRVSAQPSTEAVATAPPQSADFTSDQLELGAPNAPATVVEYLSTTCSHCAAFERDTWPQVESTYVATGKVRFVIREMPTAPVAVAAAGFLLARCAGQTRYWEVVQALLRSQADTLRAPNLAAAITHEQAVAGLDADAAQACLSDPQAINAENARRQAGLDAGVDSTPYFIINGVPLTPGMRLAGQVYEGGELSFAQFSYALQRWGHVEAEASPTSHRRGYGPKKVWGRAVSGRRASAGRFAFRPTLRPYAAVSATPWRRARSAQPIAPTPISSSSHVEGSGAAETLCTVALKLNGAELPPAGAVSVVCTK